MFLLTGDVISFKLTFHAQDLQGKKQIKKLWFQFFRIQTILDFSANLKVEVTYGYVELFFNEVTIRIFFRFQIETLTSRVVTPSQSRGVKILVQSW